MEEVEDLEMPFHERLRAEASDGGATPGPSDAVDDFDDIYGTPSKAEDESTSGVALSASAKTDSPSIDSQKPIALTPLLPGLGISQDPSWPADDTAQLQMQEPSITAVGEPASAVQMIDEIDGKAQVNDEVKAHETLEKMEVHMGEGIPDAGEHLESGLDLGNTEREQESNQGRVSVMLEGPRDVVDESISAAIESGSFDTVRGKGADSQAEREETLDASIEKVSTESLLQPPKVDNSVQDPLTFLEASLPSVASGGVDSEASKITISQGEIDTGAESMVEATAPEHLATIDKHNTDAEFELDSSPLNSDTDMSDSSSDSSSDDDADDYKMLDPEEQARRLMAEDGASDEEGGGGKGKASGPLRTQNEKPDEVVPKPDVVITEDMKIEELGSVEGTIDNLALIKAKTSGEYQVLEQGSVLCLDDKSVIGVVAETLGRVQQPYYSVRFTNAAAIAEAGLVKDTKIFYVEQYSTPVFTQPLKAFKGSDASNLHDEEVGDDELEFSDDEAEAEYKRRVKVQRLQKRMGRDGPDEGFSRGPRGGRGGMSRGSGRGRTTYTQNAFAGAPKVQEQAPNPAERGLEYDDGGGDMTADTEDLYTPLARPANLHEMMQPPGPNIENSGPHRSGDRGGYSRGRGRGDRGGNRGFGRGRGQARGGHGNRGDYRPPNNFQHTPTNNLPSWPLPQANSVDTPVTSQPNNYTAATPNQQQPYPSFQSQYSPSWNRDQAYQYPPQYSPNTYQGQHQQQPYPYPQPPPSQGPSPTTPTLPPGAYLNPLFFTQSQSQSQQKPWPLGNDYNQQPR